MPPPSARCRSRAPCVCPQAARAKNPKRLFDHTANERGGDGGVGVYRDGRGRCSALACRGPGGSTNAIDMWCSVFTKAALHGTELPGVGDGAPTAELSARGVAWTGRVDTERAHLSSARAGAIAWALPGLDTHVRATFPNVMACETTPNMVAISTTRGDCSLPLGARETVHTFHSTAPVVLKRVEHSACRLEVPAAGLRAVTRHV
jgi:hypothetical protein